MVLLAGASTFANGAFAGTASAWPLPQPAKSPPPIAAPLDKPFPGEIRIAVDATDVVHRVFQVHETIPIEGLRSLVLRFPQWSPGDHAPTVALDGLAGLVVSSDGKTIPWVRDTIDVHSFHLALPAGARTLDVRYQYLTPTGKDVGSVTMTRTMADFQWPTLVLYPAGYYIRGITYRPSVTLPSGWRFASALDGARRTGDVVEFAPVAMDVLVDSPIMAAAHLKQVTLTDSPVPVRLDLAGDSDANIEPAPEVIEGYKKLVAQSYALFGSQHYDHYDLMLWVSDDISTYFEHHRSAEQTVSSTFLARWAKSANLRSLPVHGYVHSWNGLFRRPAEMWTPDMNTPERDSLLWIFEGLTEYWRAVLSVRAGLATKDEVLEQLRVTAEQVANRPGSTWRPLQDVNNDTLISFRKPLSSVSWQREMFDAYDEGKMIWLDADTLIRERTDGAKSLDDFARAFFGVRGGSWGEYTYSLEDVVAALNVITPYDWAGFFRSRLNQKAPSTRLDGLERGGYHLVYGEELSAAQKTRQEAAGTIDLANSIGLTIGKGGRVSEIQWESPAFKAGMVQGAEILSVNGQHYDAAGLERAVQATAAGQALQLTVKDGETDRVIDIDWRGGLRYSHIERIEGRPDLFDGIFAPKG